MPVYEVQQNGKTYEVDAPDSHALQRLLGTTPQQTNPAEYDSASPQFQAKYGPLAGSSGNLENFGAGYGKAVTDLGRGFSQLVGSGPTREQYDQIKQRDAPLMSTKAGIAGNLIGNVATTAPTMAIPGVNTYAGAAAIGAGLGAAQPVGTQDSRLSNAGMGAVGGIAGKYAGDKILGWAAKPPPDVIDEGAGLAQGAKEIARQGESVGMKTTPGQASGSRSLQQMEAKWESQPLTSGPFNAIKENNAKALNRAFLKAIGENGNEVTSEALNRADTRIGQAFENAAKNNNVSYDDILQQSLSGIEAAASRELQPQEMSVVSKQLDDVLSKASMPQGIDGRQFQNIRQSLNRLSGNKSSDVGYWARQIRDSLDDALERSAGPDAARDLQKARSQYRILATALNRTGAVNPKGTVQPGILANAIAQSDKAGYQLGRNQSDLYKALRFAQAFRPIVGDSGTATRSSINGIGDAGIRGMNALLARAYLSKPVAGLSSIAAPASQMIGNQLRNSLGTAPYYAPYLLPGAGGVIAPKLLSQ